MKFLRVHCPFTWTAVIALVVLGVVSPWLIRAAEIMWLQRSIRRADPHRVLDAQYSQTVLVPPVDGLRYVDVGYCRFQLPRGSAIEARRFHPIASALCCSGGEFIAMPEPQLCASPGLDSRYAGTMLAIAGTRRATFQELWCMTSRERTAYTARAVAKTTLTYGTAKIERVETPELVGLIEMPAPDSEYGKALLSVFPKNSNMTFTVMLRATTPERCLVLGRTVLSTLSLDRSSWASRHEVTEARMRAELSAPAEDGPTEWAHSE